MKWLLGLFNSCDHEANMENLIFLECSKCKKKLNHIQESVGGIGIHPKYNNWHISRFVENNMDSLMTTAEFNQRVELVRKRIGGLSR